MSRIKEEILQILKENPGSYVSGQQLSEKLGVSRTAIWKHINGLKEEGYGLESVTNRGYRLVEVPDIVSESEIRSALVTKVMAQHVEVYETLDSTNIRAKQLAEQGAPEGTLIVAQEQTQGKGRRGRGWTCEKGLDIYMSVILRPALTPMETAILTLVAAMAVVEAVREQTGVMASIKWPNDIVVDGKKLCGILTEMSSETDYVHYAVVGIGINTNRKGFPPEIAPVAASLAQILGECVRRSPLIAAVMNAFERRYGQFTQSRSLAPMREEYTALLVNLDEKVAVYRTLPGSLQDKAEVAFTGIARGIDEDGGLLVETEDGMQTVISGEVSVRGIYGYV